MVQLNPFKWGQKGRQKKRKIEDLKIKATTKLGTGRSAAKRQVGARKELESMGETWKTKKKSKLPPKVGTGRSAAKRQQAKAKELEKAKTQKKPKRKLRGMAAKRGVLARKYGR